MIAFVEKRHEARYCKLSENVQYEKVFAKDRNILWKCGNCGYVHEGARAPQICPACLHPQAHFELFVENY
jgi:rubrerythrin